jgi:HPt (histidine-containing phosphotransfer) domain-containing protein
VLLDAAAGDDGLIGKLIDAFGRDTDARIGQMRRALATSSFPNIRAEAHTIKGSAGQMGAEAVAEACHEVETACDLQQTSLIAARLNRVQELFDEIREAMAAYSSGGGTDSSVTL